MIAERPVWQRTPQIYENDRPLIDLFKEMSCRFSFPHEEAVRKLALLADYQEGRVVYIPTPDSIEHGLVIDLDPPVFLDAAAREREEYLRLGEAYCRWAAKDVGIFRLRRAQIQRAGTGYQDLGIVGISYELSEQLGEWPSMLSGTIK